MKIQFIVIERKLLETTARPNMPAQQLPSAVHVTLRCDDEGESRTFKNLSLGQAMFELLLPHTEFDKYPIGGRFELVCVDNPH